MITALLVAVAAAVGAVCRYALDLAIQRRHRGVFPLGTTTINVVGSLILGIITGLAAHHGLNARAAVVAGVGFCGGFTTFSTWTWETLALAEADANRPALVNVIGSLGLGLAAAAAGLALTN
ncbi:MAG TPA: fluoride efflux transporter CrcB [Acidothermaceae bacterium]|jgi:CrcB protein